MNQQYSDEIFKIEENDYKLLNIVIEKQVQQYNKVGKYNELVKYGSNDDLFYFTKMYNIVGQTTMNESCTLLKGIQKKTKKRVSLIYHKQLDNKRDIMIQILKDIKLQKFFTHDNIMKCIDVHYPLFQQKNNELYYVTEYMDTNLQRVINSLQSLNNEYFQYFMYQIIRAIYYIHSAKVIHCNLTPFSVLINSNSDLKLTNFQLSQNMNTSTKIDNQEFYIKSFSAPELICQNTNFNEKVDIWSAGCIFAELILRSRLFNENSNTLNIDMFLKFCGTPSQEDICFIENTDIQSYILNSPHYDKIQFQKFFKIVCSDGLDLLDKMLQFNPEKRIDALACLQHPFFKDLYEEKEEKPCNSYFDWSQLDKEDSFSNIDICKLIYRETFIQSEFL